MSESFCTVCGNALNKDDKFCQNCGAGIDKSKPKSGPIQNQQTQPAQAMVANNQQFGTSTQISAQSGLGTAKRRNQTSELAFIFAIIGLVILPILGGVLAIIFGIIGVQKPFSKNKAIWAIILGAIEIAGYIVAFGFIFEWF